jgi:nitrate reductase alpha subunit
MKRLDRRRFLKYAGVGAATILLTSQLKALATNPNVISSFLEPVRVDDPFAYPNRGWERIYRDMWSYDYEFHWLCNPNDTHGCLLKAYVKNGVVVRVGPSYNYGKATDIDGNRVSNRWDPRICNKGVAMVRRFYGDRRIRGAYVRKGFLQWVKDGFPRDPETGALPAEYTRRGEEEWVKVPYEEAYTIVAKALLNIIETYTGEKGAELLRKQGYDDASIERWLQEDQGAGTRLIKVRGGMPLLAPLRLLGWYRFGNMLALVDHHIRGVEPNQAKGAIGFDNYSWHTDLPPGHTMVTGMQTLDYDLFNVQNCKLYILWGKNWFVTKMPDVHWLTESRIEGVKTIGIFTEVAASSRALDELLIIRPATDPALALGMCYHIIKDRLYDEQFVKEHTDLVLLVRLDTMKLLRGSDLTGEGPRELQRTRVLKPGEKPPAFTEQDRQYVAEALRKEWDDPVIWDQKTGAPYILTRDDVGEYYREKGVDAALEGEFEVELKDGRRVRVAPVFELVKRYILSTWDPDSTEKVTWAPKEAVRRIAEEIAANKGKTIFMTGMGPNQFFNGDLKDRAILLLAALTGNIGKFGGTVGSYAGNYRIALLNGMLAQWAFESPFEHELDPEKPAKPGKHLRFESAHFYSHLDKPLRGGNKLFTGRTHIPVPTKAVCVAGSNSILGNAKGAYQVIMNGLRRGRIEMYVVSDWWWTMSCEYADVVFGVDSWCEDKFPDITASVTNPFLQARPRTPLPRIFDTRADVEVQAGIAKALGELLGDPRFEEHWRFINEGRPEVYLNRGLAAGNATRGYRYEELEELAKEGIPALLLTRTHPKVMGYEQVHESKPWYTKTGRLEFYRDEDEWLEYGEAVPVHREPVDATPYEPNTVVARINAETRDLFKFVGTPERYGMDPQASLEDQEERQVRNVIYSPEQLLETRHPLMRDGFTHVLYTPKYRHGAHTTPIDTDIIAVWFGPFGDPYRHDKRTPFVSEGYMDINPLDAKELGLEDGDYVAVNGDPRYEPFEGWQDRPEDAKVANLVLRVRYYPGIPPGTARIWFHMYQASHGSVKGHETRPDGLAKNEATNYQAMYRYGGHQALTRSWLRPTLLTDTMARKNVAGQIIWKGFEPDVHCANGAPRESFVKIVKLEDGGLDGKGVWYPVTLGIRPTYESEAYKRYLAGGYVKRR